MKTTAFFIVILLFVGCAKDSSRSGETTWVEHGDPNTFLEGVKAQSELTKADLESLAGWWPHQQYVIGSRSTLKSLKDYQNGESSGQRQKKTNFVYQLELETVASSEDLILKASQGEFRLEFSRTGRGGYHLNKFRGAKAQLVHFSRHQERQMVNLLVRLSGDGTLISITLANDGESALKVGKIENKKLSQYFYMMPEGARWREPELTLSLCGFPGENEIALAKKALSVWQAALGDRLRLRTQILPRSFAPFSDLNLHCIYWDKHFKPNPTEIVMNIGRTVLIAADKATSIADADVMIYATELAKQKGDDQEFLKTKYEENLYYGLVHEIGHVLGLDHPPTPGIKSVMKYQGLSELQPYDIKAIQTLYDQ